MGSLWELIQSEIQIATSVGTGRSDSLSSNMYLLRKDTGQILLEVAVASYTDQKV